MGTYIAVCGGEDCGGDGHFVVEVGEIPLKLIALLQFG